MDKQTVKENSEAVVDSAAEFHKSLKELREFSTQLYCAADYCKTTFLTSKDKKQIVETTKEYVSRAVVVVVDHVGTISANLESCISKSDSVPETECKIQSLKQRIGMCQDYSYRISLHRFHWGTDFSRYHRRYVSPHLKDSTISSNVSCYSRRCMNAKKDEEEVELLHLDTYCKPSIAESSGSDMKKKNAIPYSLNSSTNYKNLLHVVDDGLSVFPKTRNSVFQFQDDQKIKRGTINWKVMVQSKDITAFFKRGKRLLA